MHRGGCMDWCSSMHWSGGVHWSGGMDWCWSVNCWEWSMHSRGCGVRSRASVEGDLSVAGEGIGCHVWGQGWRLHEWLHGEWS